MFSFKAGKFGPWKQVGAALSASPVAVSFAIDSISKAEAELAAQKMREAIESHGQSNGNPWPRLSIWTSAAKGNENQLRDWHILYNSIKARKVGMKWEAGVDPNKTSANGKPLSQIVAVHEQGLTVWIQLTARMAAYLAIRARELGIPPSKSGRLSVGDLMMIQIPQRSFIAATKEAHFRTGQVAKRMAGRALAAIPVVELFTRGGK